MLPILAEDRLIGSRIEKCVVERLIGRGGYGLTFLAFDEELREHRVVKVSNAWSEDEAGKKRQEKSFIEEGLILSRLKHPQIVTLRGQGERQGHRYMVLDYIQGFSLKNILDIVTTRRSDLGCRWEDVLDPATATALVLSSLHPLEYAHRANVHLPDREIFGVAHRDISPGNLILGVKGNEKGKVILIDFGTAKTDLSDTTTVNQHLVGTVPYMSKARLQKAASPNDALEYHSFWRNYRETQNDIHALGVLFYQLLTGRLPFPGETTPQIIVRVLDPESYSNAHREVALSFPILSAVLRKCLVYFDFSHPQNEQPYQYPDASAMRKDLEEVFANISQGRSVQEILTAFSDKLAEPDKFSPPTVRTQSSPVQAESAEFVLSNLPGPYQPGYANPNYAPRRRIPVTVLAGALATCSMVAFAILTFRDKLGNKTAAGAPAPALERLETLKNPAKTGSDGAKAAKRPQSDKNLEAGRAKAAAGAEEGGIPAAAVLALLEKKPGLPVGAEALAAAEAASGAGEATWGKEAFVQLQTMMREENPAAYEKISEWLTKVPDSPDLLLLRSQLILKRNPASEEARQTLADLQMAKPAFHHPRVFHENTLYLLWQADAATFEAQKTPANRIKLLKSANAYLSEYQANPAYGEKIKRIQARMPQ